MATSREPLGIAGERRYPLSPLPLPQTTLTIDELAQYDVIRLFVERAAAILPHFALTTNNAGVIASICRRLDGIPLAIELASARINVLTLEQIAARLDDRFRLLATAAHVTHSHHRTLHAAIEWSYTLLSSTEQLLLRRLSVFAGGCSLATMEAVCVGNGIEREAVLELLSSLVAKSLVTADTAGSSESRYRLLEMIRQYAQEALIACDEWLVIYDLYLRYYVQATEEIAPKLYGQDQHYWFDWLEAEHDNIRAALAWALEQGCIENGARMAIALYQFWDRRGYMREGFAWYERLIGQFDDTLPVSVRVKTLTFASFTTMFTDDTPATTFWSQRAVALCEATHEGEALLSFALSGAVGAARMAGDMATAYAIETQIVELDRAHPDNLMFGMALFIQGWLAIVLGKYDAAHTHLNEAMGYARQSDDTYRAAVIMTAMGDLARREGRYADAIPLYEKSLALLRELGSTRDIPDVERALAYACLRQQKPERAHALFTASLQNQGQQNNRAGIMQSLRGFAAWAAAVGLYAAHPRLHGYVMVADDRMTRALDPTEEADKADYAYYAGLANAALDEAEYSAEMAQGRVMTLQAAIAYALSLVLLPRSDDVHVDALTEREREVARLIARGLSNGEIAETLVLSKRTVEKHIANILSKLGFTNRIQIARWAMEQKQSRIFWND